VPAEEPNPMTQHLLGAIEGRQQAELAKISIMGKIAGTLVELQDTLERMEKQNAEIIDRMKG